MTTSNSKKSKLKVLAAFLILIGVVVIIGLIGYFILKPEPLVIQGQVEATEVRVSGKLAGRVLELYVKEGMQVQKGDTLVQLDSPELFAKLSQAEAAENAAQAQSNKATKGARQEQITAAFEMWKKAEAGVSIAEKSYNRVQSLFDKGVIAAQKRDEVEAQYKAAVATAKAAKSQYDMAVNGAEQEDKQAAQALVDRAKGAVSEVSAYLNEVHLTAPISGEISEIFPKQGELIGTGSPVMNIVDLNDIWFTFNVREDLLYKFKQGAVIKANVPALNNQEVEIRVNYIKALGSYATWKATKLVGDYDTKTFEVRAVPVKTVEGLRPGMSVLITWDEI